MAKTNFQYDESGTTFYYVLLTFLGFILLPSTYYFWPTVGNLGHKELTTYMQTFLSLKRLFNLGQKEYDTIESFSLTNSMDRLSLLVKILMW
jgi:hypothetical protein